MKPQSRAQAGRGTRPHQTLIPKPPPPPALVVPARTCPSNSNPPYSYSYSVEVDVKPCRSYPYPPPPPRVPPNPNSPPPRPVNWRSTYSYSCCCCCWWCCGYPRNSYSPPSDVVDVADAGGTPPNPYPSPSPKTSVPPPRISMELYVELVGDGEDVGVDNVGDPPLPWWAR